MHPVASRRVRALLAALALLGPIALSIGCASIPGGNGGSLASSPPDLYRARCTSCHSLRDPGLYPVATLDRFLNRFAWRAGVTRAEKEVLRAYFRTVASDAVPTAGDAAPPAVLARPL